MNVFIDCGTHMGEGMELLAKKYSMDDQWKIFAFEPNKNTYAQAIKRGFVLKNVIFENKAVWISDDKMLFHSETPPSSLEDNGCASSLIAPEDWKPKTEKNTGSGEFNNSYKVDCVHLSKFIKENFSPTDRIVLKLDIEGAEFAVLDDLITSGAIKYVDDIYVEFHEWAMKSKTRMSKYVLILRAKMKNWHLKFKIWY